ncbi:hypothetical protein F4801DRAFT_576562 [Xylaria longipes]|nr:hypothetical protein F4801DRAFT_576562 [Xylaria longipes]
MPPIFPRSLNDGCLNHTATNDCHSRRHVGVVLASAELRESHVCLAVHIHGETDSGRDTAQEGNLRFNYMNAILREITYGVQPADYRRSFGVVTIKTPTKESGPKPPSGLQLATPARDFRRT